MRIGLRLLKPEAVRWLQRASQQGGSIAPRCLANCSRGDLCGASAGRPLSGLPNRQRGSASRRIANSRSFALYEAMSWYLSIHFLAATSPRINLSAYRQRRSKLPIPNSFLSFGKVPSSPGSQIDR